MSQTSAAPAAQDSYVPALDGLRGAAIVGVLLFHTDRLPGGFLGVDLFFALSGYLITGQLLREVRATGGVSLTAFWGRRTRRLLPALAVLLVVVTVLVRLVGSADLVRTTLADGPWVQANLVNWHLLAESAGYWDRFGPERVFEHLWSIAVEEQFYLCWPVVVALLARLAVRGRAARRAEAVTAVAAVVVSVLSLALMVGLHEPSDPARVYTGTDTRAFSLLLGAAAATAPVRALLARLPARAAGAALGVLVVTLGVTWALVDGTRSPWLYTGGLFAHSLLSALLVGLVAQAPAARVSRALARGPLPWLGTVSYSLYLWHWPVAVLLAPARNGLGDGWGDVLVWLVSVALAAASKYLVEDPVRFRAPWARGRRGVLAAVAVTAALVLLWVLVPGPAPTVVDVTRLG